MGTNYYLYNWHGEEVAHLCKTSGGWVPLIKDQDAYDGWDGFVEYINRHGHIIKNEYGERVEPGVFVDMLKRFRDEYEQNNHQIRDYTDNGFDFNGGEFF